MTAARRDAGAILALEDRPDYGLWFGRCLLCGQVSGLSFLEPTADDRRYIGCPKAGCGGAGKDGTMIWEAAPR